jgi:MATE family multidrug resistance protein
MQPEAPAPSTQPEIGVGVADVFKLAWPVMVSMLSFTLMSVVDTLFVARLGTAPLAAVGFASTLVFTSQSFGGGLMAGLRVVVAQLHGAGEHERGIIAAWQGLWLATGFGLLVALLCLAGPSVFGWLGASETVATYADEFFSIRILGAPVVLVTMGLSSWFQGRGDTRTPMNATLLANGLNIILDPILIFGLGPVPALGVSGAAIATVTSLCVGVIYLLWRSADGLRSVSPALDLPLQREIWRIGGAMGVRYFLEMCSFSIFAAMLASVGAIHLAAHVIGVRIVSMSFLPGHAISEATGVIVGQLIGAGQSLRTWTAYRSAVKLCLGVMGSCGLVFVLAPHWLLMPFDVEPMVLNVAMDLLFIAAITQLFDAYVMAAHGALNGAGDTRFVMISSVAVTWLVKLPIAWFMGLHLQLGAVGAWMGLFAEFSLLSGICFLRIRSGRWLEHVAVGQASAPDLDQTG